MEAQNKDYNVYVVRSVWRRLKKGHIEIHDLDPKKDVKGGASVTGSSKTVTSTGSVGHQSSH